MFEALAFTHRVPLLTLLLFVLVQAGCAPARHSVRLQTTDGQVRMTMPPPRPPLVLPKEAVRQTVRALSQKLVPVADPVEFARERFEMPVREGFYILNARTKELKPADKTTEATEEPSPEALKQARDYLRWCEDNHQPFDCFGGLHGRRTLDAYGRYTVTMGIAIASTFERTKESLADMVNVKEVLGMVVAGVTMYAVLWVIPEPTSKAIAAAMTIVLVGWVGVDTLYTLGTGWKQLIDRADTATTFEVLKEEGERFARVMGADNARILVMVATAAMGSGLGQLVKLLPTLPGAAEASEFAVQEGSVPMNQVGAVESVTIGERGLTISLTTGAVLATSLSGNFGSGPRINLVRPNAASTWGDPSTLEDHFQRHGADFGARSPEEYARMGSEFMRRAQIERLPTKMDRYGVTRIYDPSTNTFGAYNPDGTTRTFFKPARGAAYWADQPGDLL